MVAKKTTAFIKGKINWAKVLGDPVPNYDGNAREWSFEVEPDEAGIKKLVDLGFADRIKGKGFFIGKKGQYAERTPYIRLKKSELMKDGTPNKPIRIYDGNDDAWDQNEKIGNGSGVDVKLDIRDYGPGKIAGIYPAAIRVTDLIEYTGGDFGGMDADDHDEAAPAKGAKGKKKDAFKEDFGLDDEIPF